MQLEVAIVNEPEGIKSQLGGMDWRDNILLHVAYVEKWRIKSTHSFLEPPWNFMNLPCHKSTIWVCHQVSDLHVVIFHKSIEVFHNILLNLILNLCGCVFLYVGTS